MFITDRVTAVRNDSLTTGKDIINSIQKNSKSTAVGPFSVF